MKAKRNRTTGRSKPTPPPVTLPDATDQGVTIHRALALALTTFCPTRPPAPTARSYRGIGIDVDPAGVAWIMATDGYTLARARLGSTPPGVKGTRELAGRSWQREYVDAQLAAAKSSKATHVTLAWDAVHHSTTTPPGHAVIPTYGVNADAAAAIDGRYLARVGMVGQKLAQADDGGCASVVLRSYSGAYDPLRWDVVIRGATIVEVIVMPMRVELPAGMAIGKRRVA